jgi:hypothetical protein
VIWLIIFLAFTGGVFAGMWAESHASIARYRQLKAEHEAAMDELAAFLDTMPNYTRMLQ